MGTLKDMSETENPGRVLIGLINGNVGPYYGKIGVVKEKCQDNAYHIVVDGKTLFLFDNEFVFIK